MNELTQEKCKYCGRDLSDLEIYEKCSCQSNPIDYIEPQMRKFAKNHNLEVDENSIEKAREYCNQKV